jgi:hypothetical protein
MDVYVVNTKRQNHKDRHGWKVDFELDERYETATIYQNVYVWLKTVDNNGEEDDMKYSFTEAWNYKSKKRISDSFLVPVDWRKNQKGYMKVKSVVWSNQDKMDPKLKRGTSDEYWGNLHGSFDKIIPTSQTTKRKVTIEWDNLGESTASNFTKGKDLTLKKNRVD